MFNPNTILYLVGALAICTVSWNVFTLSYCYRSRQMHSEITRSRAMNRWMLKAQKSLVLILTVGICILTVVQLIRNYYLVQAYGDDLAPHWLFWVVVCQNVFFYGLLTAPGVILFAYVWGLKALHNDAQDTLTEEERSDLGMEDRATARNRRAQEQGH